MVSGSAIKHEVERISRLMRAEAQGGSPAVGQPQAVPTVLAETEESPFSTAAPDKQSDVGDAQALDSTLLATTLGAQKLDVSALLPASKVVRRSLLEANLGPQLLERQHRQAERELEQQMQHLRAELAHEREQLKLETAVAASQKHEAQELARQLQAETIAAAAHQQAETMVAATLRDHSRSDEMGPVQSERDAARAEVNELLAWREAALVTEALQSEKLLAQREESCLELSQHRNACVEIRAELQARSRASAARLQAAELEESAAQRHSFEAHVWLGNAEAEAREALAMAREMTSAEAGGLGQEAAAHRALAVGEAHAMAEAKMLAVKLVDVENASVLGTAGRTLLEQESRQLEEFEMRASHEAEALENFKQEALHYKQEYQHERHKQDRLEHQASNIKKAMRKANFVEKLEEEKEGHQISSEREPTKQLDAKTSVPTNLHVTKQRERDEKSRPERDEKTRLNQFVALGAALRNASGRRGNMQNLANGLLQDMKEDVALRSEGDAAHSSPSKGEEMDFFAWNAANKPSVGSSLNVIQDADHEDSDDTFGEEALSHQRVSSLRSPYRGSSASQFTEIWDPNNERETPKASPTASFRSIKASPAASFRDAKGSPTGSFRETKVSPTVSFREIQSGTTFKDQGEADREQVSLPWGAVDPVAASAFSSKGSLTPSTAAALRFARDARGSSSPTSPLLTNMTGTDIQEQMGADQELASLQSSIAASDYRARLRGGTDGMPGNSTPVSPLLRNLGSEQRAVDDVAGRFSRSATAALSGIGFPAASSPSQLSMASALFSRQDRGTLGSMTSGSPKGFLTPPASAPLPFMTPPASTGLSLNAPAAATPFPSRSGF